MDELLAKGMMSMENSGTEHRRALVVGAGNLGRVMAARFAGAGYDVLALSRSEPRGLPAGVRGERADLETPQGVESALLAMARLPLHVLLVTAGAYAGGQAVEETPPGEFERLLWVNASLPFHILRCLIPAIRAANGSAILVGALGAQEARPRQISYNASKAALHSIVQSAAQELKGTGATVNALLPLTIDTTANREAMPGRDPAAWVPMEHLADLALFLASPAGHDITGALIPVRGGL